MKKLRASVDVLQGKLNEEIEDTNCQIKLLESTVEQLKTDADKFSFAAEKKTSLVNMKANAMRRAASEKPEMLKKLQNKKKRIMEMKSKLTLTMILLQSLIRQCVVNFCVFSFYLVCCIYSTAFQNFAN